jgi:hypothetical protein
MVATSLEGEWECPAFRRGGQRQSMRQNVDDDPTLRHWIPPAWFD